MAVLVTEFKRTLSDHHRVHDDAMWVYRLRTSMLGKGEDVLEFVNAGLDGSNALVDTVVEAFIDAERPSSHCE